MDPTPTTEPSIPISSLLHANSPVQTDPVTHAERQVEDALDELVTMGALQTRNRMDIEALLNPAGESHVLTETSDKEIYQAVIDAISARENVEVNVEMMLTMMVLSRLVQLSAMSSRQYQPLENTPVT